MSLSIRLKDSLHIACDIESKCDDFIATDKDLLNKTAANIITIDPTNFVRKMEDRTDPHLIIQSDKKLWTNLSIDEIHNTATERGDSR